MILNGVRWVVERSRHVQIDTARLTQVCAVLDPTPLHQCIRQVPDLTRDDLHLSLDWLMVAPTEADTPPDTGGF